jgi:putative ABC transport system permease protein
MVRTRMVSHGYFQALDIPILQGQSFTEEQQNSTENLIILSKQLATRLFLGKNPIGEHLQLETEESNAPWYRVIGVAANVKNNGLTGEEEPEYYILRHNRAGDWSRNGDRKEIIIIKTSLPLGGMSPWIRSQAEALDPTVLVNVETLRQRVNKMADQPRFETVLVGLFALTGLLLSMIGLYGIMAFVATQRTQEIGVRMALGASRLDILRLISQEGVRLIALGGVSGLCLALGISKLFASLLFSIGPYDPVTFIGIALLLFVVGLVATLVPARSATKVDPIVALRYE